MNVKRPVLVNINLIHKVPVDDIVPFLADRYAVDVFGYALNDL